MQIQTVSLHIEHDQFLFHVPRAFTHIYYGGFRQRFFAPRAGAGGLVSWQTAPIEQKEIYYI